MDGFLVSEFTSQRVFRTGRIEAVQVTSELINVYLLFNEKHWTSWKRGTIFDFKSFLLKESLQNDIVTFTSDYVSSSELVDFITEVNRRWNDWGKVPRYQDVTEVKKPQRRLPINMRETAKGFEYKWI